MLTYAMVDFLLNPVPAQTPTPSRTTTPALTSETKPASTLGDTFTQLLPDGRVTFRLLAPKANAVEVVIGTKNDVHAPGTTGTEMTKDANGLWTVTLGPFEPNLYQYQFSLDGLKIADPGNDMPKPQRHVDTSLLLIPAFGGDVSSESAGHLDRGGYEEGQLIGKDYRGL